MDPREQSPYSAYRQRGPVGSLAEYLAFGIDTVGSLRKVPLLPWPRLMRAAEKLGRTPTGPVVFECVGVPRMLADVIDHAPLHSRVVVVGVCMQPDTIRPAVALHKEIDLRFVFGYDPGEFSDTLRMIADGTVDPSPLHTGTVGLAGVAGAFEALGNPEKHAKILVDPTL
ncbi:MAG: hypothetical protein ICV72_06480 [Aldersonia sp.]|nr:hypothetical protein [Aldersonia sp.]